MAKNSGRTGGHGSSLEHDQPNWFVGRHGWRDFTLRYHSPGAHENAHFAHGQLSHAYANCWKAGGLARVLRSTPRSCAEGAVLADGRTRRRLCVQRAHHFEARQDPPWLWAGATYCRSLERRGAARLDNAGNGRGRSLSDGKHGLVSRVRWPFRAGPSSSFAVMRSCSSRKSFRQPRVDRY